MRDAFGCWKLMHIPHDEVNDDDWYELLSSASNVVGSTRAYEYRLSLMTVAKSMLLSSGKSSVPAVKL